MAEIFKVAIPNLLTLIGVIITVIIGNNATRQLIKYRIEQLEKKQDKHNSLIERMYEAEKQIGINEEQIKAIHQRIDDLESKSA